MAIPVTSYSKDITMLVNPNWVTDLKLGVNDYYVKGLQRILVNKFGIPLTVDANFCKNTESAVKVAKGILKLPVNGIVTEADYVLLRDYKKPIEPTKTEPATKKTP
jgi:hypothetical protein